MSVRDSTLLIAHVPIWPDNTLNWPSHSPAAMSLCETQPISHLISHSDALYLLGVIYCPKGDLRPLLLHQPHSHELLTTSTLTLNLTLTHYPPPPKQMRFIC